MTQNKRSQQTAAQGAQKALAASSQLQGTIAQRFWRAVDRIRTSNAERNPDEEGSFIRDMVEEVRQERYDAAQ